MATMDKQEKQTLLIALGGNALVRKGQVGTIEEQFENLKVPIRQIARLSRQYKIIITHGNGSNPVWTRHSWSWAFGPNSS
jgi:carbamate kinase